MTGQTYKYDVAFSFLAGDERVADEINELLKGRLSTFLYSKRQETLAGRDGEEVFNRVFGSDARVVVVLYRTGWGNTPWTRIEQTAIRNRAYDGGYDFTLFIQLDGTPVPDWLPKTRLWFGLERYGQEGAAAVVERLVQEAGGVIRPETAEDKVARLARDLADEGARVKLRQSEEGVGRATDAAEVVLNEIRAITVATPGGLAFAVTREPRGIAVYANGVSVVMVQSNTYTNTVDHFRMVMTLWAGRPDFAGVSYLGAKELGHRSFVPDFDRNGEVLWRGESSKKAMTSRQLAETAVTGLLDEIRKDSLKGR